MKKIILLFAAVFALPQINGYVPNKEKPIKAQKSSVVSIDALTSNLNNTHINTQLVISPYLNLTKPLVNRISGRLTYEHPDNASKQNKLTGLNNLPVLIMGYTDEYENSGLSILSYAGVAITDKNGYFALGVPSKKYTKVLFYITSASEGVNVIDRFDKENYVIREEISPSAFNTRNKILTANFNYKITDDDSSIPAEALAIASGMHIGYEYATEFSNEDMGTVDVIYPSQSYAEANKETKTEYNHTNNKMYIDRKLNKNGSVDWYYNTIDTLLHEYGHRVQDFLNIGDNPGGKHFIEHNAADTYYTDKEHNYSITYASRKGEKLAYAEGWATAFSLLAQDYYEQKYSPTNIPRYNGPFWNSAGYGNDDYDTNVCSQGGEASEFQVGRFLYNLVDADQGTNMVDILQISHSKFWSLSTKNKPKTFAEFYQNCLNDGISANAMGMLLMKFHIAPGAIANLDSDTASPKLTWTRNGGVYYQNDQFIIKFYDKDGYIKRTVSTTSCPYTLSKADINFIKTIPGNNYYVQIAGSNSNTIDEMYYNSHVKTLSKPSIAK